MKNEDVNTCEESFDVINLRVEYSKTPLGIDVEKPRFSWQMSAPIGRRDYVQTAYQLVVKKSNGVIVWDSSQVKSDNSLNIIYAGSTLQASTRYIWTVTVWNQEDSSALEVSWFETGLMNDNPDLTAWDGAAWIGGSDEDLVLYSHYLSVFKVGYTLKLGRDSTKAGFILGANDSRLMDKNKNIYNVESLRNSSYIKFELDISALDGSETGLAKLNIYRMGYKTGDMPNTSIDSFDIPLLFINEYNKYTSHDIYLWCNFGIFDMYIDGIKDENKITICKKTNPRPWEGGAVNVNPVGVGHDYISFPMVADIGFSLAAGETASFANLTITNYRYPSSTLFKEDLLKPYEGIYAVYAKEESSGFIVDEGAYVLTGGTDGTFIVADPSHNSMPMLRSEFATEEKQIHSARLYVTARGIYEMYINGIRVGEDYFNPGSTQYNKTQMYQTYDVTAMLKAKGNNAIGAWLGEGWWSGSITYSGENWNYFGDRQSILAKLIITYADGSIKLVTTNSEGWKYYNDGPIIYGSFFQGEVYDATKEALINGWDKIGYDDSNWKNAVKVALDETTAYLGSSTDSSGVTTYHDYDNMSLIGQIGENVGVVTTLTAQTVEEIRKGVYIYDMGQNIAGIPRINIKAGRVRDKITLRFAEVRYPDMEEYGDNIGMIMLENIRAALAQDTYILKGGDEVIQPRFTFHGFRYIEITGTQEKLPLEAVQSLAISSMKELASSYETSNDKVNRLWQNIVWSQRDNFLSIPTDCPQRNERLGWSGDISVYSRTSTYIGDADLFLTRHMYAMRDIQQDNGKFTDIAPIGGGFGGILWGSAGITVPWEIFQQYGDALLLEKHYDSMKKYVSFLDTKIDANTGLINEGPLGDWLGPENRKNEPVLLWSAYHAYDLWIMAKTSKILGKTQDEKNYLKNYEERKEVFNNRFVDPITHKTIYSDGKTIMDTQTSYAVPLALGIFSNENISYAAEYLVAACKRENKDDDKITHPEYSLMTGFIGTAWISKALSDYGYSEVAYRLLQQTSYPSWLYSIDQGATTIWERLNSYTIDNGFGGNNSMNSFNHYSFGAVGAWMYNYSLGIQRDEENPGFKKFILQPIPDPDGVMTWAKGHYDSTYGTILSSWERNGSKITYKITVPANTTAKLYVKAACEAAVTENGKLASEAQGVNFVKYEKGKVIYELKSGSYEFKA
ncbi:MAG TPA: family 78 glycoside hydrolase catalytic domain [Clostridiaceae bacterium]